ncbi:MAG TPA: ABC transporter ATP-binding protein [Fimbriimonadaceae bacterium]
MLRWFKFKKLDPRITSELKSQKRSIRKGLSCVAVTSVLTGFMVLLVKQALQYVEAQDLRDLCIVSALVVGVFGVKYSFTRGSTYYLSEAGTRLTTDLRNRMFRKLQLMPISFFNRSRTGIIQSVLTNDVNLYSSAIGVIRDSIDGPVKAFGALITIFVIQWQLGLICVLFLPPIAWMIAANGKMIKVAQSNVQNDYAELKAMSQESLQGVRVIKAFSAQDRILSIYEKLTYKSYDSQMEATKIVSALRPLIELVGAVAIAAVLLYCVYLSKSTQYEISKIGAVLYAFDVINSGFRTMGNVNTTYNQVQAGADRVYKEILDQPIEVGDDPSATILSDVKGRVEFRNVSFTYADGTDALRDVSFVIEPDTSLALVGSSGAGKSTIADLLLRFYEPTSGEILLDGVNISSLKLSWYRALIGVVPQHVFLFSGSIKDNILFGRDASSIADVEGAAKAAHADGFIEDLPQRYDTVLGETGVGISGGEKQRVAIARAVIRKPQILLLDEATSSLDAVSEKKVQEALDEVMQNRTTLFIAHRLTSAARADTILMLSHGEVIEGGSHQELLKKGGAYAAMYRAFSSGVLEEAFV